MRLTDSVSLHFTWYEAVHSQTAERHKITNIPSQAEENNIYYCAAQMEHIRTILGNNPIIVTSWYRNEKTNRLVGGSPNSAHLQGLAVDFSVKGQEAYWSCSILESAFNTMNSLDKNAYGFDQLILEYSWVHIAWKRKLPGSIPRLQVLTYNPKKRNYLPGLVRI